MIQTIELNLIPNGIPAVIYGSQWDQKRKFKCKLYEGTEQFTITSTMDITINGSKPDGTIFLYTRDDGVLDWQVGTNIVTITTALQISGAVGETTCQLRITDSDSSDLGTVNFTIEVSDMLADDESAVSETELPSIIAQAKAQEAACHQYAEDCSEYYQGAQISANNAEAAALRSQTSAAAATDSEDNAKESETNAATSETNAASSATAAGVSETNARRDSLKSEGFANGTQDGTPVTPGSPYYNNNAKYWRDQAASYAAGGLNFMGSVAFAGIPTSGMNNGDMYNITDDFTTDSRFIEGAGISCKAGADIAWITSAGKWDLMNTGGGSYTLEGLSDTDISSPQDGQVLKYNSTSGKWENGAGGGSSDLPLSVVNGKLCITYTA